MSSSVPKSSNVPFQLLGYTIQGVRAVTRLAECSAGDVVSVEVFDDVGVKRSDGSTTTEQTKSARNSNPISDRAPEMWKTFAIWTRAVKQCELEVENTTFEMYISPPRPGTTARDFHKISNIEEAREALDTLESKFKQSPSQSDKLTPYLDFVFAERKFFEQILPRFNLVLGSISSRENMEDAIRQLTVNPNLVEQLGRYMHGWVLQRLQESIEEEKPANLHYDEFKSELISFHRKLDSEYVLPQIYHSISPQSLDKELKSRTYIEQLNLLSVAQTDLLEAASDFLMASAARTDWAAQGLVNESSFDDLESDLTRLWKNKRRQVEIRDKHQTPVHRGQLVLSECLTHSQRVQGMDTPGYFIPGCFHFLADRPLIGWHPEYEDLLGIEK